MLSTGALIVYASYFFWVFVPFTTMVALLAGGEFGLGLMLYLLIGAFMIYMNGRLFINFLFWEQTAAFGDEAPLPALRESRELARCAPDAPRPDRPLYRGVMVASVWLASSLGAYIRRAVSLHDVRFSGARESRTSDGVDAKVGQGQTPDALMIASDTATAVLNLLLRPLLAAAFIVLYYDAKARSGKEETAEPARSEP